MICSPNLILQIYLFKNIDTFSAFCVFKAEHRYQWYLYILKIRSICNRQWIDMFLQILLLLDGFVLIAFVYR